MPSPTEHTGNITATQTITANTTQKFSEKSTPVVTEENASVDGEPTEQHTENEDAEPLQDNAGESSKNTDMDGDDEVNDSENAEENEDDGVEEAGRPFEGFDDPALEKMMESDDFTGFLEGLRNFDFCGCRNPSFEIVDAEVLATQNLSFNIPSLNTRQSIMPCTQAKLIFRDPSSGGADRMWVRVSSCDTSTGAISYTGELVNTPGCVDPAAFSHLIGGNGKPVIKFEPRHVIDIYEETDNQSMFVSNVCASPSCSNPGTKRCSRCAIAWYCSKRCQRASWPEHKSSCQIGVRQPIKTMAHTNKPTAQAVTSQQTALASARKRASEGKCFACAADCKCKPDKTMALYRDLNGVSTYTGLMQVHDGVPSIWSALGLPNIYRADIDLNKLAQEPLTQDEFAEMMRPFDGCNL